MEKKWEAVASSISGSRQGPPLQDPAAQSAKERFVQRLGEARKVWPKLLAAEKEFWASQPADAVSAPFPADWDHCGFVCTPEQRAVGKLSDAGVWLYRALDNKLPPSCPPPPSVSAKMLQAVLTMWEDEAAAAAPGGCKIGRPLVNLALHSSKHQKPVSRNEYDPAKDLQLGECAVVLMDADQTPGNRGWDLVMVDSKRPEEGGSQSYNVRRTMLTLSLSRALPFLFIVPMYLFNPPSPHLRRRPS